MTETKRTFIDGDRYVFDFKVCTYAKGWAQIDTRQDASYFGTWCSPTEFKIVNYCEGDVSVTECASAEEFKAEIERLVAWNDEHGWGPARIDPGLDPAMSDKFVALGLAEAMHGDPTDPEPPSTTPANGASE